MSSRMYEDTVEIRADHLQPGTLVIVYLLTEVLTRVREVTCTDLGCSLILERSDICASSNVTYTYVALIPDNLLVRVVVVKPILTIGCDYKTNHKLRYKHSRQVEITITSNSLRSR